MKSIVAGVVEDLDSFKSEIQNACKPLVETIDAEIKTQIQHSADCSNTLVYKISEEKENMSKNMQEWSNQFTKMSAISQETCTQVLESIKEVQSSVTSKISKMDKV